jgi:hypothetical protein
MDAPSWNGGPDDAPISEAEHERRTRRGDGGYGYRCLDCTWTGRAVAAADHHYRTHHAVALKVGRGVIIPRFSDDTR